MTYRDVLDGKLIAISISESEDLEGLGYGKGHLHDAMAEVARHILALGGLLAYGGDLRQHGFSEVLFELVARHRPDIPLNGDHPGARSYLAWPVHIRMPRSELVKVQSSLAGTAELILVDLVGNPMSIPEATESPHTPTIEEWSFGLSSMRRLMAAESFARIVMGGQTSNYKGAMPGIAEEAMLSLEAKRPLFIVGGFGGCAGDIANSIGLHSPSSRTKRCWPGLKHFSEFSVDRLNNGLTYEENAILANTPHIDEAVMLIMRGLVRRVD
ncbi:hypothetical protein NP284_08700 [Rhodopseudomonas pseudopalustris]|uniref:hypothetical protein n=1 Tax=Rhodopseudomonas pseudopalustris TaxID=1513892 RepID=UPI003F9A38D4